MFKRIEKRRRKQAKEEKLGLNAEIREILGLHDTDSEESASESDSSSSEPESGRARKLQPNVKARTKVVKVGEDGSVDPELEAMLRRKLEGIKKKHESTLGVKRPRDDDESGIEDDYDEDEEDEEEEDVLAADSDSDEDMDLEAFKRELGVDDSDIQEEDEGDEDDEDEDDEGEEGEEGEEEEEDENDENQDEDPSISVAECLKDPIYTISIQPETKSCIVCVGKQLKGSQMAHQRRFKRFQAYAKDADASESAWEVIVRNRENVPKLFTSSTPAESVETPGLSNRAAKKKAHWLKKRDKVKAKKLAAKDKDKEGKEKKVSGKKPDGADEGTPASPLKETKSPKSKPSKSQPSAPSRPNAKSNPQSETKTSKARDEKRSPSDAPPKKKSKIHSSAPSSTTVQPESKSSPSISRKKPSPSKAGAHNSGISKSIKGNKKTRSTTS